MEEQFKSIKQSPIVEWYVKCIKQYATFTGRARRTEFWMFALANFLIAILIGLIGFILNTDILSSLYSLLVLVPNIAVAVRRLHDIGKSGWFYLVALIPIIGWIWLLILFCQDSQPGGNEYGPNPKEAIVGKYQSI